MDITCFGMELILYAGDYISEHIDAAGLNVEFFYSAKHRRVMEKCNVNDTLKQVFEYCTDHYGPLFFYGEEGMRLIEIGVQAAVMLPEEPVSWARTASVKQGLRIP